MWDHLLFYGRPDVVNMAGEQSSSKAHANVLLTLCCTNTEIAVSSHGE
jgi:hypothetical protein